MDDMVAAADLKLGAFFFGGVHAVASGPMGVEAVGDTRRAGAAAIARARDGLPPSSPAQHG